MKKSKIFLAAGALVLAITALFTARANKKFSSFTTAYIGSSGAYVGPINATLTTKQVSGNKTCLVSLYTALGGVKHVTVLKANTHTLYVVE